MAGQNQQGTDMDMNLASMDADMESDTTGTTGQESGRNMDDTESADTGRVS
jgi:hypothetical protein